MRTLYVGNHLYLKIEKHIAIQLRRMLKVSLYILIFLLVNNKIIHLIPGKLSHDQSNSVSKFDHTMFVSIEKVQPVS